MIFGSTDGGKRGPAGDRRRGCAARPACARARVNTERGLSCTSASRVGLVDLAVALEGHLVDDRVLDRP